MRHRLQQQAPNDGGGGAPIPPELAAQFRTQAAAAVQVHQGNPQIPVPPEVMIQQARASGGLPAAAPPPANPAVDFWGAMANDGDISQLPPPVPPTLVPPQQPPVAPAIAPQPAPITRGPPQVASPTPQPAAAAPSPVPGQPPVPTAEDPFDINRLLAGIQIPAPSAPAMQPSQPVAAPTAAPPQAAPAAAPAPPVAAPNDEELQRQAIAALMPKYNLSPEDDRAMISEPGRVIPKLAAQLHLSIARDIAMVMAQQLPMMIGQHARAAINANRAEMEFFSRYPSLNQEAFKPIVAQSLAAMRSVLGPQATREDVMRQGAAMAALRIRSQFQRPTQAQAPTQPFVPANGGAPAPVNPSPSGGLDIWSQLAEGDSHPW